MPIFEPPRAVGRKRERVLGMFKRPRRRGRKWKAAAYMGLRVLSVR